VTARLNTLNHHEMAARLHSGVRLLRGPDLPPDHGAVAAGETTRSGSGSP
jgi:hypothetical protein